MKIHVDGNGDEMVAVTLGESDDEFWVPRHDFERGYDCPVLADPEDRCNWVMSYGHYFPGSGVMRYETKLCDAEDVRLVGEIQS